MLPPQPSPTVGEQDVAGHVVAAVQHLSWKQMAGVVQLVAQLSVLPQPSSTDAAQLPAVAHVAAVQPHTPFVHGPFAQSVSFVHFRPGAHFGHVLPPQSVSLPFFVPSVQVGSATHAPDTFEYFASQVKSHLPEALQDWAACAGGSGQATHGPSQPFAGAGLRHCVPQYFSPVAHGDVPPAPVALPESVSPASVVPPLPPFPLPPFPPPDVRPVPPPPVTPAVPPVVVSPP
jgi:hypothetical protein